MSSAENKTKPTKASVAAFLKTVENAQRLADAKVVDKLMREESGEKPAMWGPSIVGFGTCHYKYESGREGDMPRVAYSPRSTSMVLYVLSGTPSEAALLKKLGKHKTGKSCLYINKLADVDLTVLRALVRHSLGETKKKYG